LIGREPESFAAETLLDQSHLHFGPQHIGLTYKSAVNMRRIWSFYTDYRTEFRVWGEN
jgi:hypothetical protein